MQDGTDIFGRAGSLYSRITRELVPGFEGRTYSFSDQSTFQDLRPQDMQRVYWSEILYRAHWAAASAIIRHDSWYRACLDLASGSGNFLGFSAALRGLVEASADACKSLKSIPRGLAVAMPHIRNALAGELNGTFTTAKEMEDELIHFLYARKVEKLEYTPESHRAWRMRDYLENVDQDGTIFTLYSELCQIAHPAAYSIHWAATSDLNNVRLSTTRDAELISDICSRHAHAVEVTLMQGINPSLLILTVLNWFGISEVSEPTIERYGLQAIPEFSKLREEWEMHGGTFE